MLTRNEERQNIVLLCMDANVYGVIGEDCGCPVGKEPCENCSCLYVLEEFSCLGKLTDALTDFKNGTDLDRKRCQLYLSTFDPCQPEDRKLCEGAIEKLHCDLLQFNQHSFFGYFNSFSR